MSHRVFIPTAGTGSRLGDYTKYINKSLVSIADRPALAHLIEQFSVDTEFVIALGHKGYLVREFLTLAYPQRQFFFADVEPFEGPGSGLGLSLLACKQYLQQPFVFISCDTMVKEPIPAPNENWMAYAEVSDLSPYRSLDLEGGLVTAICEKGEGLSDTNRPYIGLSGIHDYQHFWLSMESGGERAIQTGESHGLRALLPGKITARRFTWYDTGNPQALERAREAYREPGSPNILEKSNEAIWFVNDKVIKFSDDQKFIANRVKRVHDLQGFVPDVKGVQPHMYLYSKVEGKVLSEVVTVPLFDRLLEHSQRFWIQKKLSQIEMQAFQRTCMSFYREKTFERVDLFYKNFSKQDGMEAINGVLMPKLDTLLDAVDWDWLAQGMPARFHGDFHFENILWNDKKQQFTFLDWRQDFGGDLLSGDVYYDLGKLLHGLIINHELIARDLFSVEWGQREINYDFHRKQILVECERHFTQWNAEKGYDNKKVRTMAALIYLNIAALHHHPYSLLLYSLGKSMLKKESEG